MALARIEEYTSILVESFYSPETNHRGFVHIHPCEGQVFSPECFIECRDEMKDTTVYPLGTVFRICVKEKKPKQWGARKHLYCPYHWSFDVVG